MNEQPKDMTIDEWIASLPQRRKILEAQIQNIIQQRDTFIQQANAQVDLFNQQGTILNGQILELDEMLKRVAPQEHSNGTSKVEEQA